MRYSTLRQFLETDRAALTRGPIAMVFAEDDVELGTTLRHHRQLGFETTIAFMESRYPLPSDLRRKVIRIDFNPRIEGALQDCVNTLAAAAPGQWMFYCYNAEYLFYPFCETRRVSELLSFHAEERRDAMLTYVVDLYAGDLHRWPLAVSLDDAHIDRSGYYALARNDPANHNHPKERQLDFYGGLRWRYEEHVPKGRRKIDRIALFRAKPGLRLREDHTFSDEEYNTYACPWHNNLTAAVCSFRVAKALRRNPGSSHDITSFRWHNSAPFDWSSRQLMDLGLMEPGQWF